MVLAVLMNFCCSGRCILQCYVPPATNQARFQAGKELFCFMAVNHHLFSFPDRDKETGCSEVKQVAWDGTCYIYVKYTCYIYYIFTFYEHILTGTATACYSRNGQFSIVSQRFSFFIQLPSLYVNSKNRFASFFGSYIRDK